VTAPDAYVLAGHPVSHSRSPLIHARFAAQTGQHLTYGLLDIAPGQFAAGLARFRASGGCGLNVTLPHKEAAWSAADVLTDRARIAGAVNTIWWGGADGACHGDNTDGVGMMRDLEVNEGRAVEGLRVLLVGAGGAARGALGPLIEARPAEIVIANRSPARAEGLATNFRELGMVEAVAPGSLEGRSFDLVINATGAGLSGARPWLPDRVFAPGAWAYDMLYGPASVNYLEWARHSGAERCLDGVGMLVEQAAESFWRWRGVRPETPAAIEAIRALIAE
jgi:shikimate dehydrogenase